MAPLIWAPRHLTLSVARWRISIIHIHNVDKHIPLVLEVLSWLDKASLRVNLKKSSFHIRKVEFLAYIISEQVIEMFEIKIEEVKNWAVPWKVKDVQEFLRLANFYCECIQGFAQITVPLTALTHKDEPWSCTPRFQKAFDMSKHRFTSAPILAHFDATLPSIIETNASDYAVGAMHSQTQNNGRVHPVAFLSWKFSPPEINYDIHDKEMVAIVLAFQEWIYQLKSCKQ